MHLCSWFLRMTHYATALGTVHYVRVISFIPFITSELSYRFGHVYDNLEPRVTRTLLHAFLDPTKSLPQHYGAIQGLSALGPSVVCSHMQLCRVFNAEK